MAKLVRINDAAVTVDSSPRGYVRCGETIVCLEDLYPKFEDLTRVKSDNVLFYRAMQTLEDIAIRREREHRKHL